MIVDGYCELDGPADELLRQMDRGGVDRAVIQPPDRCFAWENEAGNEMMITAAEKYPARFFPAVTVNPWRPDAVRVLQRYLPAAKLLAFSPGVQGFLPSEDRLDPILETVTDIPIYIHTGHHSSGAPSQLALLAKRFPRMNFIMGHTGSTDYAADVIPVCRMCPNIYIESSFARPPGFVKKLAEIGFDRGIFGSGYPYNDLAFEVSEMKRLCPEPHHRAVFGANFLKLMGTK